MGKKRDEEYGETGGIGKGKALGTQPGETPTQHDLEVHKSDRRKKVKVKVMSVI